MKRRLAEFIDAHAARIGLVALVAAAALLALIMYMVVTGNR